MGIFSNPKCPKCGGKTVETGHSFPYPQLKCNRCGNEDTQKRKDSKRIKDLEERLRRLEQR